MYNNTPSKSKWGKGVNNRSSKTQDKRQLTGKWGHSSYKRYSGLTFML